MKHIACGLFAGVLMASAVPALAQGAPDTGKTEQQQKPKANGQHGCFGWGLSSTDTLGTGLDYDLPVCAPDAQAASVTAKAEQPQWQQDEDNKACLAQGMTQGTDAYDECRVAMSDARIREGIGRADRLHAYVDWEEATTPAGSFHGDATAILGALMTSNHGMYAGGLPPNQPAQEASTATTVCSTEGIGADEKKSCDTHVIVERKMAATPMHAAPPRAPHPMGMADLMWRNTQY